MEDGLPNALSDDPPKVDWLFADPNAGRDGLLKVLPNELWPNVLVGAEGRCGSGSGAIGAGDSPASGEDEETSSKPENDVFCLTESL